MKSGPTLKPWTIRPRRRKASSKPSVTVVLPTPLATPAITRMRGVRRMLPPIRSIRPARHPPGAQGPREVDTGSPKAYQEADEAASFFPERARPPARSVGAATDASGVRGSSGSHVGSGNVGRRRLRRRRRLPHLVDGVGAHLDHVRVSPRRGVGRPEAPDIRRLRCLRFAPSLKPPRSPDLVSEVPFTRLLAAAHVFRAAE